MQHIYEECAARRLRADVDAQTYEKIWYAHLSSPAIGRRAHRTRDISVCGARLLRTLRWQGVVWSRVARVQGCCCCALA